MDKEFGTSPRCAVERESLYLPDGASNVISSCQWMSNELRMKSESTPPFVSLSPSLRSALPFTRLKPSFNDAIGAFEFDSLPHPNPHPYPYHLLLLLFLLLTV